MPELPEVEVLVRYLRPLVMNQVIQDVTVYRPKVLRPTSLSQFKRTLVGTRIMGLKRRGKYLRFSLEKPGEELPVELLAHLGMTGRIYLLSERAMLPKHTTVSLALGKTKLIFEDPRYFGRVTLDTTPLSRLGPEPLTKDFTVEYLAQGLRRSTQPIKVKLLDQSLVCGVGNIYASEALFRAGISPTMASRRLSRAQIQRLRDSIRRVLSEAIKWGSTVPLNWTGLGRRDGLFYYGRAPEATDYYGEKLAVYDRKDLPCPTCGKAIRRLEQGGRSTYYCPSCQRK